MTIQIDATCSHCGQPSTTGWTVEEQTHMAGDNAWPPHVCKTCWTTVPVSQLDSPKEVDLPTFLEQLAASAQDGQPAGPALAGTFAMYPHIRNGKPTGGIVLVLNVEEGPDEMKAGPQHAVLPSGMIRAAMALAGGGGKLAALRSLTRRAGRL